MKIYIAHPYGGKEENKLKVESIIKDLVSQYDNVIFISPIHLFGYLYSEVSYSQGMEWCLNILKECDELWLCDGWTDSKGCRMEYDYAKQHHIPIKHI